HAPHLPSFPTRRSSDLELQRKWTARWLERQEQSLKDFEEALADGLAPEQARLFLYAYGLYTVWRWTASIQSVAWFLHQRDDGKRSEEHTSELQSRENLV